MKFMYLFITMFFLLQCQQEKTITALGNAEIEVPADYLIVNCNISIDGYNKSEINKKSSKIAVEIQKELKKYNINKEQIVTINSLISKSFFTDNHKYISNIKYKFPLLDLNKYDDLKKSLLKVDATEINIAELHLFKEDSFKTVVFNKAINKAKRKAELFVNTINCKIIGIINVLDYNFNLDEITDGIFKTNLLENTFNRPSLAIEAFDAESFSPTTKFTKKINAKVAIKFRYE